ncbi:MAG: ATP-grasp domain-containing protein [Sedimenticola sp.]
MKKLHVAISGISASDNPAPGTGVARSLLEDMEIDYHLAGLAYDALEPGIYMDWLFERSFMVPYPTASQEALIQRLLYIRHHFGLDVAVPTLDSELPFYINNEEKLREQGIHTFLPTQEQFRLRGKEYLSDVAQKSGISAPQQQLVTRQDELIKAVGELGLPVMIKGTLYKAYAAHTLDSALALFGKIAAEWGFPVIVQQLVHGEEMNVIGVGDGEGGLVGMVAARKMSVTELGKIWTGVTVTHPALAAAAKSFVTAFEWRGAFEMECIVAGDQIQLIEINPRFPAWVYFATGVGINLPAMLVRLASGEEVVPKMDYPAGKLFVRHTTEQVGDMNTFQNMITRGES